MLSRWFTQQILVKNINNACFTVLDALEKQKERMSQSVQFCEYTTIHSIYPLKDELCGT